MNRNTEARLALLGIGLGLGLAAACAQAAPDEAATQQVRARLVASVDAVHAGDRLVLGVHQQIAPEWHTYWINPGDTGLATKIDWTLPPGSAAGKIQWPTPQRFQLGSITNFGYAGDVTLLTEIDVPKELQAGQQFPVQAQVNWLVCRESCIPQKVELRLNLPVLSAGQPSGAGSPLIDAARTRLPVASPWPVKLQYASDHVTLSLVNPGLSRGALDTLAFFPAQRHQLSNELPQTVKVVDNEVLLQLPHGDEPPSAQAALTGVLVVNDPAQPASAARGYTVNSAASPLASQPATAVEAPASASSSITTLASVLLLALLGGIVLNLMPCVFPVLSIKALSLLQHAERPARETRRHGLAYTLGVLASFALLGGLLIVLRQGGAQIGWGFQYQSPGFVLVAAYLMFAVGLSLSGVFSVGASVAGWGSSLASRVGYSGSFFTGVLAAVVASPCTAPFMGAAIGYALTQPAAILLAVFLTLGLGLALPYLLLTHWPALQHRLPRPGRWMERVKQGLAFPMYAAAVWLAWVLAQQAGSPAVAAALGGMLAIAFAAWVFDATRGHARTAIQRSGAGLALLAVTAALLGGQASLGAQPAPQAQQQATSKPSHGAEPYSAERLQSLRSQGQPVFLNLTAAWCITCLVNERVALSDSSVLQAFERAGIHYLKGDWTNQDEQITRKLGEFGRSGVPLYVYYPANAGADPVVLPQILTPQLVLNALQSPTAVSVAGTP
ncbi:protein-disulfide reductase DsbD family protein [Polaromonas hydrogenivorans]|uniref:Protein-disulfide reductase DsbD domain-containing protein n=1 Tax=Polaromonas hydrogenivorans TaxID=335476 RepID=A0AAU7LSW6_9BURK